MSEAYSARNLFDAQQTRLELSWVAGQVGAARAIDPDAVRQGQRLLVSRLNCIQPSWVQVIGEAEAAYLASLGRNSRADMIEQLFGASPMAVIVAEDQSIDPDLVEHANYSATPLFSSPLSTRKLIGYLQGFFSRSLAEKTVIHGVFMEVKGIGVLITGESGVGKSELALELLSRGHRLVADDAPEFTFAGPDTVLGSCPPMLRDFIEVRGLGILNVRSLFGDSSVKHDKFLRLIVHLKQVTPGELLLIDRLEGGRRTRVVLDVEIAELTLPVAPGRNLAVLVEAAVSNHILLMKGYNSAREFIKRQQDLLGQGDS